MPVPVLVSLTEAPGTLAPEESTTEPVTEPVMFWENPVWAQSNNNAPASAVERDMVPPVRLNYIEGRRGESIGREVKLSAGDGLELLDPAAVIGFRHIQIAFRIEGDSMPVDEAAELMAGAAAAGENTPGSVIEPLTPPVA